MYDIITSYIGYLENVDSMSYAALPNVDTLYFISKDHVY